MAPTSMTSLFALALLATSQQSGPQIYEQCVQNLRKNTSVSGRIDITTADGIKTSKSFRILTPDCYEMLDPDFELHFIGAEYQVYFPKTKQYVPPMKADSINMTGDLFPFTEMLQGQRLEVAPSVGSKTFADRDCHVLSAMDGYLQLFVAKDTLQPLGYMVGGNIAEYKNIRMNEPMTRGSFTWQPPKGAIKYVSPEVADLLGPGNSAPDFDLKVAGGSNQTLKGLLNGKKGLWLNFWFIGCVPCEEEFTHLATKLKALEGQGLAFVTANAENGETQILQFLKKKAWDFPVLLDRAKVSKAYGITAVPTNYIIDPNGEVVAAIDGFDERRIKAALAKIGIVWPG